MNLSIPMSAGLGLIILVLVGPWLLVLWRRPSTRSRQWLLKSSLLGAAVGLIVLQALHPTAAKLLSWLPNQGLWLEFGIIAGLSWGLTASILKSLPFDHDYPQPVTIKWRRYGISVIGLMLLAMVANRLPISAALVLSAGFVTVAVLTSAWYPVRLMAGLIGGLIITLIFGLVSLVLASVWSELPRFWHIYSEVYVGSDWPLLILAFTIGLAIPGLSAWWLGQPERQA